MMAFTRLTQSQRGTLNAQKTGISGTPVREEDWTLDATGNWPSYVQKTSGNTDLNQTRTHNKANEVLSASSWAHPGLRPGRQHDRVPAPEAGNATRA